MPERGDFDMSGGGATTGSFVHKLFECGVQSGFNSKQKFVEHALKMIKDPAWNGVDIDDVNSLIDVFWERNKDKYDDKSKTEVKLSFEIDGFRFYGIADRIDVLADGSVEIIDYKTNKNTISLKKRSWQLGFYAIGLQKMGFKVSRLTLDMLRLEKPVEMNVGDDGNVTNNGRGSGFNLEDVKSELIEAAKSIAHDYEHEFDVTGDDNNCRFCGYKFYCPKFDED